MSDGYFKTCLQCKGATSNYKNYCSWSCHIEHAKSLGAVEIRPNGLPIRAITADGKLLECEDGDHPTYICPIEIEPTVHREEDEHETTQTHALIYTDGKIAVSVYERCYALSFLKSGQVTGSLWPEGRYLLTEKAREIIWDRWIKSKRSDR